MSEKVMNIEVSWETKREDNCQDLVKAVQEMVKSIVTKKGPEFYGQMVYYRKQMQTDYDYSVEVNAQISFYVEGSLEELKNLKDSILENELAVSALILEEGYDGLHIALWFEDEDGDYLEVS